jgi:hypothetical protein
MTQADWKLSNPKKSKFRFPLTVEQYTQFMEAIQNGISIENACHLAGIAERTCHRILRRGEDLKDEALEPGTYAAECVRFWQDYKRESATYVTLHTTNINKHATASSPGQWTASAWILERKKPKEFSNQYQLNRLAEAKVKEVMQFLFQNGSDAFIEELAGLCGQLPSLSFDESESIEPG